MFGWVAGWKQVMLPHCVTGWPDEGVWGLFRPPTAAATALSGTDGCLHVKAVTPTTTITAHMLKYTTYDRSIVVTCAIHNYYLHFSCSLIWLYILVLTDLRPALRDTRQGRLSELASVTLPVAQCQTDSRASLCAGYSQSAGWGEGSDSPRTDATLTPLMGWLWSTLTLECSRLVLCDPSL